MSYSSRDRDRGRRAVVAATGVGAVGALTATGWLMGAAASDLAAQQAASTDATPTAAAPTDAAPTGRRERPYVTRVTLRYVTAAGTASSVPGSGGTLTRVSSRGSGSSGSSGPSGSSSGPGPAAAPVPAPEPAPPAPSSGS